MTIRQAIDAVDKLKKNAFKSGIKIKWLSDLDRKAHAEIIMTHSHPFPVVFNGYTDETDIDTELLIKDPYGAQTYVAYLQSMIDRETGETAKYNVSAALFNQAYTEWTSWYNRTHMPHPRRQAWRF